MCHCRISSTVHCWFQQAGIREMLPLAWHFSLPTILLHVWLSSSSPTGAMALSEVIACSGAFSQTSSAASHFPSRSRVNVTHKTQRRFDGEIKKKEKAQRRAGRKGKGGGGTIPSSPIRRQRVLRVIPPSRASVFRGKYNKTSEAATRHQKGCF